MESRRTPLSESATNARVQAKPADQPVKQQSLAFRALSPLDDPELADAAVQTLSEALALEQVVSYFVKGNRTAAQLFWLELLRARLRCAPEARQIYCLSDLSTVAVLHQYPRDRATRWDLFKHGSVLRFASAVPLGKWRALNECGQDLERQKQAFLQSHGEFLYLEVIATAARHRGKGLGSMLLHHICSLADAQRRYLYVEASSEEARAWYRRSGFQDVMTYTLRPHCPKLLIMARPPRPQQPPPLPQQWQRGSFEQRGGGAGAAAAAGAAARRASTEQREQ